MYKIMMVMLVACTDITFKSKSNELDNAIKERNIEAAKELLKSSTIQDKNEALIISLKNPCFETTELLLNNGADVNIQDDYGNTPLIISISYVNKKTVQLLLDHNADIDLQNRDGTTALIKASSFWRLELIELLLNNGANVNACDKKGNTSLMLASLSNSSNLYSRTNKEVKLLLYNGADVNAQDNYGRTALMLAISKNDKKVVKLLLNNSANISIKDKNGKTVIDLVNSYALGESLDLFNIFKKVIINKIFIEIGTLNIESALQLLTQFRDYESIYIISTALKQMTCYYNQLEDYNFFELELALSRLKRLEILDSDSKLKSKHQKLLKSQVLYIARACDALKNNLYEDEQIEYEPMEDEQIELLEQIAYGVGIVTEKVNNEFVIKERLPNDIFNVISSFFLNIKSNN